MQRKSKKVIILSLKIIVPVCVLCWVALAALWQSCLASLAGSSKDVLVVSDKFNIPKGNTYVSFSVISDVPFDHEAVDRKVVLESDSDKSLLSFDLSVKEKNVSQLNIINQKPNDRLPIIRGNNYKVINLPPNCRLKIFLLNYNNPFIVPFSDRLRASTKLP